MTRFADLVAQGKIQEMAELVEPVEVVLVLMLKSLEHPMKATKSTAALSKQRLFGSAVAAYTMVTTNSLRSFALSLNIADF